MSTGEKFCTGKNCLASAGNNYGHSDECLAEYELVINSAPPVTPQSMQAALQIIAEKDVRIAELGAESAEWSPVMQRLGDENQQLRVELAASREQESVGQLRAERLWGDAGEYSVSIHPAWLKLCREQGGEFHLYAAPVAKQVVMPDALDRAFITGESYEGVYRVVIESETLKEMQSVHSWLARLNVTPVQQVIVPDGWVVILPDGSWSDVQTTESHANDLAQDIGQELSPMHTGPACRISPVYLAPAAPAADAGLVEALEKVKAATRIDDPHDHYDMVCGAIAAHRAAQGMKS